MSKLSIANRWNGEVIVEGEFNDIKSLISAFPNANLSDANLSDANLSDANLRGANLRGANLRGANLDYACWPLWCGSTKAIVDDRIKAQLLYHALFVCGDSVEIPQNIKDFVNNNFHHIGELPKL